MRLRDFFYLNKSDRYVLMFFLALGIVVLAIIMVLSHGETETPLTAEDSLNAAQTGQAYYRGYRSRRGGYDGRGGYDADRGYYADGGYDAAGGYYADGGMRAERFPFDPNTADSTAFLRLGLRPWQVRNIYKYRARGGVYRRPQDFARLYGLTQKQYRELEPYIRISNDYRPAAELYHDGMAENSTPKDQAQTTRLHKIGPTEHILLNSADTTELQRVPGIGSYFARRIATYRQRLGGFYSPKQLLEIDDFPEEALKYFAVDDHIRRLSVNKLSLNELKRHPYINYYQAKAITDYRRLKGPLHSLDDLRLMRDFTPQDMERLKHYVEF